MTSLEVVEEVLAEADRVFAPGNEHGVVGYAWAPRVLDGKRRSVGLVVYVAHKLREVGCPVPELAIRGPRGVNIVRPDVLGVGEPRVHQGGTAEWSGIHPAATIAIRRGGELLRASASALWTDGGARFLTTAGHAFPSGATRVLASEFPGDNPEHVGDLVVNLLDSTPSPRIDVALVKLTALGIAMAERTSAASRPPRVRLLHQGDFGRLPVSQAFCPSRGDYSGRVRTERLHEVVHIPDPHRGALVLRDLVRTTPVGSRRGDSGTLLATADESLALASCVGAHALWTYFEPLSRARDRLASLGHSLQMWRLPP